jgi:molybdopterin-binding protein
MEVVGVIKDGKVELPASVHLPEGAEVRVIVSPEAVTAMQPFERAGC